MHSVTAPDSGVGSSDRCPPRPRPVAVVVGTRPEAIKVAPLVRALRAHPHLDGTLWATTQHGQVLTDTLADLGLAADVTVPVTRTSGSLTELAAGTLTALEPLLAAHAPAALVVHGDTLTTLAAAQAAYWARIPVVHLEAGLRTGTDNPFPEESNRRLVADLASVHLAPTEQAAAALRAEAVRGAVYVTGNTVVDALHEALARPPAPVPEVQQWAALWPRLALATMHRRDSWGAGLDRICAALLALAADNPALGVVVPAHPNPAVAALVRDHLGAHRQFHVTGPLPYSAFLHLLARADLAISDSGGVQEEAPTLGVPAVVLRESTERPEGLASGLVHLAGTDPARILTLARAVLAGPDRGQPSDVYGDGHAGARAAAAIAALLGVGTAAPDWSGPSDTLPAPAPASDPTPAGPR